MNRRQRRNPRFGRDFSSSNRSKYEERTYYNEEYSDHKTFKTIIIIAVLLIVGGAVFAILKFAVFGSTERKQETIKNIPAPTASDTAFSAPTPELSTLPEQTTEPTGSDSEPTHTDTPEYTGAVLKYKSDSPEVKTLQERLISLGYLHITEATTYYGHTTQMAVRAFQRQHNLTQTGDADEQTLELLYSDDAQEYKLQDGDDGEDVKALQEILVKLHYISSSDATGHYGSVTRHAIRDFQDRNDLEKTGIADRATIDLLYEINSRR